MSTIAHTRGWRMREISPEVEDTIIRALDHGERGEILRLVNLNEGGMSYKELMGQMGYESSRIIIYRVINSLGG
jgi:hypothetical protein